MSMEAQVPHKNGTDHLLKTAVFNIDDWPAFTACVEQAAELFGRLFGKLVQGELEVEVRNIVHGPASDLIDAGLPHVTNVLKAGNWDAALLAGMPRSSVFTIVELLFGGDGSVKGAAVDRDCTKVELAAAELVFHHLAAVLQSSFAPITDPGLEPGTCAGEVVLDSLGSPAEPTVLVNLSCLADGQSFELFVGFAQQTLSVVGDALQIVTEVPAEAIDPKWAEHFDRQSRRADVKLSAIMDGGDLTLDELSRLQVGQVVELKSTADSLIKVDCSGHALLWCRLGQSDGSFVLRVEQFADAEQDLMDELLTAKTARQ